MHIKLQKSLIERKLENPEYRKRYEHSYGAFKLEAQILYALEQKGWTYDELARAMQTSKGNICRDLKAGGIQNAAISRISRMAEALEMRLVALLIPHSQVRDVLPKIEAIARSSMNSVTELSNVTPTVFKYPAQTTTAVEGEENENPVIIISEETGVGQVSCV